MSLYVGIDVRSKDFKVRILDQSGNEIAKCFRATNDRPGNESSAHHLRQACTEHNEKHLVVGMEATSVLVGIYRCLWIRNPALFQCTLRFIHSTLMSSVILSRHTPP